MYLWFNVAAKEEAEAGGGAQTSHRKALSDSDGPLILPNRNITKKYKNRATEHSGSLGGLTLMERQSDKTSFFMWQGILPHLGIV